MYVRNEGSHLFLQFLEFLIITRLAHSIIIIRMMPIIVVVVVLIVIIILLGGIFIVRTRIKAPSESAVLDRPSSTGFDIPRGGGRSVGGGVSRSGRDVVGFGRTSRFRVELDGRFVVRMDEMGDLTFEGSDLGGEFVGLSGSQSIAARQQADQHGLDQDESVPLTHLVNLEPFTL